MRVGDLPDRRRCYHTRTGRRVHLYPGCGRMTGGGSRAPAHLLNPDAEVCTTCASEYEERSGGGVAAALEELDPGGWP